MKLIPRALITVAVLNVIGAAVVLITQNEDNLAAGVLWSAGIALGAALCAVGINYGKRNIAIGAYGLTVILIVIGIFSIGTLMIPTLIAITVGLLAAFTTRAL